MYDQHSIRQPILSTIMPPFRRWRPSPRTWRSKPSSPAPMPRCWRPCSTGSSTARCGAAAAVELPCSVGAVVSVDGLLIGPKLCILVSIRWGSSFISTGLDRRQLFGRTLPNFYYIIVLLLHYVKLLFMTNSQFFFNCQICHSCRRFGFNTSPQCWNHWKWH